MCSTQSHRVRFLGYARLVMERRVTTGALLNWFKLILSWPRTMLFLVWRDLSGGTVLAVGL